MTGYITTTELSIAVTKTGASSRISCHTRVPNPATIRDFAFQPPKHPLFMKLASAGFAVAVAFAVNAADAESPTELRADNLNKTQSGTIMETCFPPSNTVSDFWYYESRSEGPFVCTKNHDTSSWIMLNAYRAGAREGVHWKYTNDANDGACMLNWKYYAGNGQDLITTVSGRTTFSGDTKRWCALPVYRPGGVQGKQWEYCSCH